MKKLKSFLNFYYEKSIRFLSDYNAQFQSFLIDSVLVVLLILMFDQMLPYVTPYIYWSDKIHYWYTLYLLSVLVAFFVRKWFSIIDIYYYLGLHVLMFGAFFQAIHIRISGANFGESMLSIGFSVTTLLLIHRSKPINRFDYCLFTSFGLVIWLVEIQYSSLVAIS